MTAYWVTGSTLDVLRKIPDGSIDLVLSSPPFFALRSYLDPDDPAKGDEIGSEATPGEFIDTLLDVTEECLRVLAPHGTLAFELGDTYAGNSGGGSVRTDGGRYPNGYSGGTTGHNVSNSNGAFTVRPPRASDDGPLDKSLCLIPELYRIALAYGFNPLTGRACPRWRVRNVVRWVRPNPPVGALGDKFRPATSEMVIACQSRTRYFDLDAVRTAHQREDNNRLNTTNHVTGARKDDGQTFYNNGNEAGAPPLDWWEIPTAPYKGSHYATWPPALCEKPIKAMSPEKVCTTCGEPSRRGQRSYVDDDTGGSAGGRRDVTEPNSNERGIHSRRMSVVPSDEWTDCGHDTWRPGRILDPFAGSGTTLAVATGHSRDAIGIDLDSRNLELARQRVGMFLSECTIDEVAELLR